MGAALGTDAARVRSFDRPDEARDVAGVRKDTVRVGEVPVTRAVYPAGWLHSRDAGPEPCADTHVAYCAAGRLRVWWPDGTAVEVAAGELAVLPPGHDAECLEACTLIQIDAGESARGRFGL